MVCIYSTVNDSSVSQFEYTPYGPEMFWEDTLSSSSSVVQHCSLQFNMIFLYTTGTAMKFKPKQMILDILIDEQSTF